MVLVSGFPDQSLNGMYLRQPPYDNIDNQPHYIIMKSVFQERRHLFFSKNANSWRICPLCNEDDGSLAISSSDKITGRWQVIGEPIIAREVKITPVTMSDLTTRHIRKRVTKEEEEGEEKEKEEKEFSGAEKLIVNEYLEMESLFEKTLKWSDSNHESLLFSNRTHVVSFLSIHPRQMKKRHASKFCWSFWHKIIFKLENLWMKSMLNIMRYWVLLLRFLFLSFPFFFFLQLIFFIFPSHNRNREHIRKHRN